MSCADIQDQLAAKAFEYQIRHGSRPAKIYISLAAFSDLNRSIHPLQRISGKAFNEDGSIPLLGINFYPSNDKKHFPGEFWEIT